MITIRTELRLDDDKGFENLDESIWVGSFPDMLEAFKYEGEVNVGDYLLEEQKIDDKCIYLTYGSDDGEVYSFRITELE